MEISGLLYSMLLYAIPEYFSCTPDHSLLD